MFIVDVGGKLILMLALVICGRQMVAQEPLMIDFRNRVPGVLDAPIYDFDGVTRLGAGFAAQLALSLDPNGSLAQVGSPQLFLDGADAGYWSNETPIPVAFEAVLGERIWFRVNVYEVIQIEGFPGYVFAGRTPVYSMILTNTLNRMTGLESFRLMPEPLSIRRPANEVVLEWIQLGAARYDVEGTDDLSADTSWRVIYSWAGEKATGTQFSVTNTTAATAQYFRLRRWRQ